MLPAEVLAAQEDLLERLTNNDSFMAFTALTSEKTVGHIFLPDYLHPLPELTREKHWRDIAPQGTQWVRALKNYIEGAYAYRVTAEMCLVLAHAASALDEDDRIDPQLAPTGCGIVHFAKPIKVQDVRGKTMLVHWAVWGPTTYAGRNALALAFYNDTWIEPDEVWGDFQTGFPGLNKEAQDSIMDDLGRWSSVHQTIMPAGMKLGPSQVAAPDVQVARIMAEEEIPGVLETPEEVKSATNLHRYMHALFLLLNQTVVDIQEEEPNRATRRRMLRKGLPQKVTVIALRRHANANRQEGESLVEWSHRWIVRGHWRWQACGPNRSERRRIWIAPFVKGPEDKELIVTDKVYSLER